MGPQGAGSVLTGPRVGAPGIGSGSGYRTEDHVPDRAITEKLPLSIDDPEFGALVFNNIFDLFEY
jgi:hypothetical protein